MSTIYWAARIRTNFSSMLATQLRRFVFCIIEQLQKQTNEKRNKIMNINYKKRDRLLK